MKAAFKYPNFILGLISFIILLIGVGLRANSYANGDYVILAAIIIGGIHWIWAIIEVASSSPRLKTFWLIIVIIVPPLGGLIYYIANPQKKVPA